MNEIIRIGLSQIRNTITFENQRLKELEREIESLQYKLDNAHKYHEICKGIIAEHEALLAEYEKEQSK